MQELKASPARNAAAQSAATALEAYRQKNSGIHASRPVKKSKYTSIAALEEILERSASENNGAGKPRLVASAAGGVKIIPLAEAAGRHRAEIEKILSKEEQAKDQFEAFVNANFNEGFLAFIGKDCDGKKVSVSLGLSDGVRAKGFFVVEKGVSVTVLERVSGFGGARADGEAGAGLLYNETLMVEEGASATFVRVHLAGGNIVDYQQCVLGKDATLVNSNAWFGGSLVRANTSIILDGAGSRAEDFSILLAEGEQHFDLNYSSVHRAPASFSHSIFNSCLKDSSRAVYDGMIRIEPAASKTNALLETHSMLLGEKASSNQIPQLEIKTDDVKATHSATVAKIDEDELFYLQAKGIPLENAKRMVVASFLESVVFRLPENARGDITAEMEKKL